MGLALLAQTAGEVASGTMLPLRAGNRYAAAALIRQLVEVEHLAAVFEEGDPELSAEWPRADRDQRRRFWSPARLRERARRRFLPSDHSHHRELGGHPTPPSGQLLPDHARAVHPRLLWVDYAGHLAAIRQHILGIAERDPFSVLDARERGDARAAIDDWREHDALYPALQSLGAALHSHTEGGSG